MICGVDYDLISEEAISVAQQVKALTFDDKQVLSKFQALQRERERTAIIRLNDGEAKILGYPKYFCRATIDTQLKIWFGRSDFEDANVLALRSRLLDGLAQKNIFLGLPRPDRLIAVDGAGNPTRDAWLSCILWKTLLEEQIVTVGSLCATAAIHKWLHVSRNITTIVKAAPHTVFVSRSVNAAANLAKTLGIASLSFHGIPGESWSKFVSDHYPTRYLSLLNELEREAGHSLALVGAGFLGKIYCVELYKVGCAVIDMGAVFDGWAGEIPFERQLMVNSIEDWSVDHLR